MCSHMVYMAALQSMKPGHARTKIVLAWLILLPKIAKIAETGNKL